MTTQPRLHRSTGLRRRTLIGGAVGMIATGVAACVPFSRTDPPEETLPACGGGSRTITYIGDSLTNGTGEDSGLTSRFPAIIRRELLTPARILASNGSGYVQVGPASDALAFPDQADLIFPDTSLVVVLGSRNDMFAEETIEQIEENALETYERIRERAPGADILAVGPPWINDEPSEGILRVRDEVQRAAVSAGVDWLDPITEGWFAEEEQQLPSGRSRFIAEDRIHPNDEGHAYLAERLLPHIAERVCDA